MNQTGFQREVAWSSAYTSTIFLTIVWPLRDAVALDVFIESGIWREIYWTLWIVFAEAVHANANWEEQFDGYPTVDMKPVFRAVRQVPETHYPDRPTFNQIPGQKLGYACKANMQDWMEAHEKNKKQKLMSEFSVDADARKQTGRWY